MKFILELKCDNAAFNDDDNGSPTLYAEVASILRAAAYHVYGGQHSRKLQDVNGNTVGAYRFVED